MRSSPVGKLKYYLIAALLIMAMVAIVRLLVPEKTVVNEHAGQVSVFDGYDWIWMTPFENVPTSTIYEEDFKSINGTPTYVGREFETRTGIDVSEHQMDINWTAASEGLDFAYIRIGYRGSTEGGIFLDPWFERNISGASAAGLEIGVYFFSQAVNVSEAIEEAEYVIAHMAGHQVDLPVMYDWEKVDGGGARTDSLSEQIMTDCALAFCRTIENAGYEAGVYFNRNIGYHGLDLSKLTDYTFWLSVPGPYPDFYYAAEFWQYTFTASVPGVSGEADLNLRFIPLPQDHYEVP